MLKKKTTEVLYFWVIRHYVIQPHLWAAFNHVITAENKEISVAYDSGQT